MAAVGEFSDGPVQDDATLMVMRVEVGTYFVVKSRPGRSDARRPTMSERLSGPLRLALEADLLGARRRPC